MRQVLRTMSSVNVAPRQVVEGSLGGVTEGFSAERIGLRCTVVPTSEGMRSHETGEVQVQTMCLLIPGRARIFQGDGVCLVGNVPAWRCFDVRNWPAHTVALIERI